jgi:hypothetical protein
MGPDARAQAEIVPPDDRDDVKGWVRTAERMWNLHGLEWRFESVQEDEVQRRWLRCIEMIEDHLVAVGHRERLPPQFHQPPRPHETAPDGLKVRTGKEPGGGEIGGHVAL